MSSSTPSPPPRESYIQKGVAYWSHPQHKNESIETKSKYLQSKGLTLSEIDLIQKKINDNASSSKNRSKSKSKSRSRSRSKSKRSRSGKSSNKDEVKSSS